MNAPILLIEDNPGDARLVKAWLQEARLVDEIVHVTSLKEGVAWLGHGQPSAILLDLSLPDSSGMDTVCAALKIAGRAPVVVLTGREDEEFALSVLACGAQDYLVKGNFDGGLLCRSIRYARERKGMQEALETAQAQYRAIVEDQTEMICRFLPDGTLTFVNQAFCRYFGKTLQELVGSKIDRQIFVEDKEIVDTLIDRIIPDQPTVTFENRTAMRNGEIRWQQWTDRGIFDANGRTIEFQSVGRDITENKRAEDELRYLATHDMLTHLPNRSLFYDRLEHAIARAKRTDASLTVMLVDLDYFKQINDTYGHSVGDLVLRQMGDRLRSCLRISDTVARLGGDEFVVLIEENSEVSYTNIAEKLISVLSEAYRTGSIVHHMTASIGICLFPQHGEDVEALVKNADIALYRAKGKRNSFVVYS